MKYSLYVQCKTKDGITGDFIALDDKIPVSPVFESLIGIFPWMRANGWSLTNKSGWEVSKTSQIN